MSRNRQMLASATSSSQVQPEDISSSFRISGTLRLRGEHGSGTTDSNQNRNSNRRIRWSEDVVDNEGMGKKNSKVCCIYHKSRPVGESSSESESSDSSSSDTDSDSEPQNNARRARHLHHIERQNRSPAEENQTDSSLQRGRGACCPSQHKRKPKQRKPSPNAYEKMPNYAKRLPKKQNS